MAVNAVLPSYSNGAAPVHNTAPQSITNSPECIPWSRPFLGIGVPWQLRRRVNAGAHGCDLTPSLSAILSDASNFPTRMMGHAA